MGCQICKKQVKSTMTVNNVYFGNRLNVCYSCYDTYRIGKTIIRYKGDIHS